MAKVKNKKPDKISQISELSFVFDKFHADPLYWVKDRFGLKIEAKAAFQWGSYTDTGLTRQQEQGFRELGKLINAKMKLSQGLELSKEEKEYAHKIGLSIMSGHGTGKDFFSAMAVLYFLDVFPFPKVLCTANTQKQLQNVLWSEISKVMSLSRDAGVDDKTPYFRVLFEQQAEKLFYREFKGREWFAEAVTINVKGSQEEQAESLGGRHEDFTLFLIDEAAGVPDAVFKPIEGGLTGKINIVIMIYNPTKRKSFAVRSQYEDSSHWITLRWNSEESEIVSKNQIEIMRDKYENDSNTYRIRVLGLPPITDEQTLIPWEWIEDAVDREIDIPINAPVIKGLDCGGGGDKSIIATRKGLKVFSFKKNNSPDSVVLANWAGNNIDAEQPDVFRVDTIGIGWAVEGMLREKKGGIIEAADSRRTADNSDKFINKRAEMYWNLRTAFERSVISIPDDEELKNQLGAMKTELDNRGRIKILDKKIIKKELGHSPDEADALALTFFYPDSLASLDIKGNKGIYCHRIGDTHHFINHNQNWML